MAEVNHERVIYDAARRRRIRIFRTDHGTFSYELEYFADKPLDLTWCPIGQGHFGIYDTAERAEDEVRIVAKWAIGTKISA